MAQTTNEELRKEVEQIRADLAELAQAVRANSHDADAAAGRFQRSAEQLREQARAGVEQARRGVDTLTHQVGEHPMTSLITSFGVGVLLGVLLDRRR